MSRETKDKFEIPSLKTFIGNYDLLLDENSRLVTPSSFVDVFLRTYKDRRLILMPDFAAKAVKVYPYTAFQRIELPNIIELPDDSDADREAKDYLLSYIDHQTIDAQARIRLSSKFLNLIGIEPDALESADSTKREITILGKPVCFTIKKRAAAVDASKQARILETLSKNYKAACMSGKGDNQLDFIRDLERRDDNEKKNNEKKQEIIDLLNKSSLKDYDS